MEKFPLVTVCHLCYNNAPFIIQSAQSVRRSTYPNIQHIIIDDCSQDDSWDVLNAFVDTLPAGELTLVRHNENRGIPAGHNHAAELAQGKYLCSAISDDLIKPEKISDDIRLLESVNDPDVVGIFSLAQIFHHEIGDSDHVMGYHSKFERFKTGKISPEHMARLLEIKNFIPAPSVILKTDWIRKHPYDTSYFLEDYPKWVDMCLRKKAFMFREEIMTYYRRIEGSFSQTERRDVFRFRIIEDTIRCRVRMYEASGKTKQLKTLLRNDGLLLMRSNFPEVKRWLHRAIKKRKLRGVLTFANHFTSNRYVLRLAWYISRKTRFI
jgi:glycosyltransferase involved in cell wall biosynthesis